MNKIKLLRDLLIDNINTMFIEGGSGYFPKQPTFDLFPRDFLRFAKTELDNLNKNDNNLINIINCLSHLKRALDCQLDTFFYQIDLYNLIKKKNLSFDQKMFFLKNAGVIESSSIQRLNYIRNKMEHHYKIPKIEEIEVYFDLVNAFILVLESKVAFFAIYSEIEFGFKNSNSYNLVRSKYIFDKNPKIDFSATHHDKAENFKISVNPSEKDEFVYYLRAHILLGKMDYMKKEYIVDELKKDVIWV